MHNFFEQASAGIAKLIDNLEFIIGAQDSAPTATQGRRGMIVRTEGGETVADTFGVILKNASDAFAIRYPFLSASDNDTLDVDADSIRIRDSHTPVTSGSACAQGQISWDADFLYVCVATDTWKQAAITDWS